MKAFLPALVLVVGFSASVTNVQAQTAGADNSSIDRAKIAKSEASRRPGGGWDLNNLRISVSRTKLIGSTGSK